jgi:hypothetical protein
MEAVNATKPMVYLSRRNHLADRTNFMQFYFINKKHLLSFVSGGKILFKKT